MVWPDVKTKEEAQTQHAINAKAYLYAKSLAKLPAIKAQPTAQPSNKQKKRSMPASVPPDDTATPTTNPSCGPHLNATSFPACGDKQSAEAIDSNSRDTLVYAVAKLDALQELQREMIDALKRRDYDKVQLKDLVLALKTLNDMERLEQGKSTKSVEHFWSQVVQASDNKLRDIYAQSVTIDV